MRASILLTRLQRRTFVSVLAGSILLAACGGGGEGPTGPTGPTGPQLASVVLQNNSARTVDEFYFSACSATSYGSNRLQQPIAPGASRTFEGIEPGCYDFLAGTVEGTVHELSGQNVTAGQPFTIAVTN